MGPSGAGKSTFLTRIKGTAPGEYVGKIRVNNKDTDMSKFRNLIGFVPQEDVMLRNLTVKENLLHSAKSRLPDKVTRREKHDIVNKYIDLLNLYKVRHSIIGDESKRGISGGVDSLLKFMMNFLGQRKRVNIGLELVADPTVLFLDEPTSGLGTHSPKILMVFR